MTSTSNFCLTTKPKMGRPGTDIALVRSIVTTPHLTDNQKHLGRSKNDCWDAEKLLLLTPTNKISEMDVS